MLWESTLATLLYYKYYHRPRRFILVYQQDAFCVHAGVYEPSGGSNMVAMDGTYWSGQSHNLNPSYFSVLSSANTLRASKSASAQDLNYLINKGEDSTKLTQITYSNTQLAMCEIGRGKCGVCKLVKWCCVPSFSIRFASKF